MGDNRDKNKDGTASDFSWDRNVNIQHVGHGNNILQVSNRVDKIQRLALPLLAICSITLLLLFFIIRNYSTEASATQKEIQSLKETVIQLENKLDNLPIDNNSNAASDYFNYLENLDSIINNLEIQIVKENNKDDKKLENLNKEVKEIKKEVTWILENGVF